MFSDNNGHINALAITVAGKLALKYGVITNRMVHSSHSVVEIPDLLRNMDVLE